MGKAPIDYMLDGVEWVEAPPSAEHAEGNLYATHSGVFEIFGKSMRCYRLNNGQAVFNAEDFERFFADMLDTGTAANNKVRSDNIEGVEGLEDSIPY